MTSRLLGKVDSIRRVYEKGDYAKAAILALEELMELSGYMQEQFVVEVVEPHRNSLLMVISSEHTTANQKLAARTALKCAYGEESVNRAIEKIAVVTDRNDSLVRKWRKKCLERDERTCVQCSSNDNLCVHHLSYWSVDPVNRINPDNGVTLCKECHSKVHENDWFSHLI